MSLVFCAHIVLSAFRRSWESTPELKIINSYENFTKIKNWKRLTSIIRTDLFEQLQGNIPREWNEMNLKPVPLLMMKVNLKVVDFF